MKSTGLSSSRSRLFAGAVAVAAIALVAVLLPAAASADTGGSTGGLPDGGVLRLKLGATDKFTFQPPVAGTDVVQSIKIGRAHV